MTDNTEQKKGTGRVLRIKVINLLYLIFLVMAFIYLPGEFVDIFKNINKSYEETLDDYENGFYNLYDYNYIIFNYLTDQNPDYSYLKENIKNISSSSNEICESLEQHKNGIIDASDGYNKHGYLKSNKNYNITEEYFLKNKTGEEIKQQLVSFKEFVKPLVDDNTFSVINSIIMSDDVLKTSTRTNKKWEKYYFGKMPAAGAVTMLTKFQNDLKRSESIILESYNDLLKANCDSSSLAMIGKVLADSVFATYKTDIGLMLNDKTIFTLGEKFELAINLPRESFDKIRAFVKKENNLYSVIKKPDGTISFFPFEEGIYKVIVYLDDIIMEKEIVVKEIRPVIEPGHMKVLYTGIDNELNIQHSSFNSSDLIVESNRGVVKLLDSVFVLRFKTKCVCELKVSGMTDGIKQLLYVKEYIVKDLPDPVAYINNIHAGEILSADFVNLENIQIINHFSRYVGYTTQSFVLKRVHKMQYNNQVEVLKNKGALFGKEVLGLVSKAVSGDIYIFDDILVEDIDGKIINLSSIVVTIK